DNAIAERINGIIKCERVYRQSHFKDIEHAEKVIGRYIHFYNCYRPHMSIGYKVPALVHLEQGEQKKMWKKKICPQKTFDNGEYDASLSDRTTRSDESVSRNI
ncbi:integrase core domain-containing protein, partial [Bacteroides sp. ET489]|uniref:integrase core domain-containing protein n=1 Tax=Bacteroides sp. ET489 TaxID=3057126 RepID=UPI0026714D46